MSYSDPFNTIIDRAVALLQASPVFVGVDVIAFRTGEPGTKIDTLLATQGTAVLVSIPKANPGAYLTRAPFYESLILGVDVVQNVTMEQGDTATVPTALYLVDRATALLSGWTPLADSPPNANFMFRPDPSGINELTSASYTFQDAVSRQLSTLVNNVGLTSTDGYCIASGRLFIPCFTPVLAPAS